MDSKKVHIGKEVKLYALCSIGATVLGLVLRTVCLLFFYDLFEEGVGYYSKGLVPTVFYCVCVASMLFFASVVFFVKKPHASNGEEDNIALRITSAIALLVFGAFFVISLLSSAFVSMDVVFQILIKLASLMGIFYFAFNLFAPEANRVFQAVLGFGILIWAACVLVITYFDVFVPLNSPDKTILHFALLSLMMFFVSEFRCFVMGIKTKLYLFTLSTATFFSGVAAIPSLVKWLAHGMSFYKYFYYDCVILALFVYVVVRFISFAFCVNRCKGIEVDNDILDKSESDE